MTPCDDCLHRIQLLGHDAYYTAQRCIKLRNIFASRRCHVALSSTTTADDFCGCSYYFAC